MEQEEIDAKIRERLARQKEKHEEQLKAKAQEIALVEKRLQDMTAKINAIPEMEEELNALRGRVQRSDRLEVMRANNIPAEAIDDISAIFESRMAGLTEEDRQDWSQFLGEEGMARSIVLLEPYFQSGDDSGLGATSAAGAGFAVSPGKGESANLGRAIPSPNAGVAPSQSAKSKMAPEEIAAYFQSQEYRALPRDQQRAKLDELKGSYR